MLVEALGVQLLTIPYKGTAPAMNDLLGKQVDLLCDQTTNTTQQINAGSVKAYAVTSLQRVPTLSAAHHGRIRLQGIRGRHLAWHVGAEGHAQARGRQAHQSLQAGLADPKFQDRMKQLGATVLTSDATAGAGRQGQAAGAAVGRAVQEGGRRAAVSRVTREESPFRRKGAFAGR